MLEAGKPFFFAFSSALFVAELCILFCNKQLISIHHGFRLNIISALVKELSLSQLIGHLDGRQTLVCVKQWDFTIDEMKNPFFHPC
ncbi:hypothetical protein GT50_15415 [Geobacillus stearothermophilus 10]|nr:hypothetical protein GT50_15415 [Geobacillus stearothermophilus 10]